MWQKCLTIPAPSSAIRDSPRAAFPHRRLRSKLQNFNLLTSAKKYFVSPVSNQCPTDLVGCLIILVLQDLLYCSCALSSPTSFVIFVNFICCRDCGDSCKNLLMQCTDIPVAFIPTGDVLEVKASPADNHAALTGAGPSGGEDLH